MAQVFQIENGQARVTLDGDEKHLTNGELLYIPPKIVHGFEFSKGTEGMVLSFPASVVQRLGPTTPTLTAWLSTAHRGTTTPATASLIFELARSFATTGTFRTQRLVALSHALIATLAADTVEPAASLHDPNRQFQRLDALIAEHLGDGWGPGDYASALHITTGHLSRIVRGATGGGLSQFLETAVMTEACRLLAFTRLSVAEVGYRLGYIDPPYFTRRFRTRMGETPTRYRARVAGETP